MINWRKLAVSSVLASTITFSGVSAWAASFDDVTGLDSEISISKLVSLGYMTNAGTYFHPDSSLSRLEFADLASRITKIGGSTVLKIKDLDTSKGRNTAAIRAIRGGLLSLNKKGEFSPKSPVTYSQFTKALAVGLGFKTTWSNRPLDYLFYLDRKGVLDIDTDLDAVVTRGDAAMAVDKYLMVKQGYHALKGVISDLTANGLVVKTKSGLSPLKYSSNASLFLDDQATEKEALGAGTEVQVLLNAKGEAAFVSGTSLQLFDGTLAYDSAGKLKVNSSVYTTNFNLVVNPLPSSPDKPFTYKQFSDYSSNGVTFKGSAYLSAATDEVTMLSPYISNIAERPITISGNAVTFLFMDDFAFDDLTLNVDDATTYKLSDGTTTKDSTLADITAALKANAALAEKDRLTVSATSDVNQTGTLKNLTVTIKK